MFLSPLTQILWPFDEETFFKRYWEKEVLLVKRDDPTYYQHIVSLETIDQLFSRRDLFYPQIRVFKDGCEVPAEEFTSNWKCVLEEFKGLVDIDKISKLYGKGATFDCRLVQRFHLPLMNLCKGLEQQISFAVNACAFLTPRAAGYNLRPHFDIVEGFIMQIGGQKCWRIWRTPFVRPLMEDVYPEGVVQVNDNDLIGEYTLNPGDMLYIPGGLIHAAKPLDAYSLHVTVAVHTPRWFHLISKLTAKVLEDFCKEHRYCQALPLPTDLTGIQDDSELRNTFADIVADFHKCLSLRQGVALINQNLLLGSYPSRPGQILDLIRLDTIGIEDIVSRREMIAFTLTVADNKLCLNFHNKTLTLPKTIEVPVRFIAKVPTFAIKDLPGSIDDYSRLVLVRRLVKEGLLTLAS